MGNESVFETDEIMKTLERTLGGYVEKEKGVWHKNEDAAYLNELGVIKIMSIVKTHMNKNVYLSNLSKDFIRDKRCDLWYAIFMEIGANMELFQVRDEYALKIICECVDTVVYSSIRTGIDGVTSIRYFTSLRQSVIMSDGKGGGMVGV
jgi:hypothetical protein